MRSRRAALMRAGTTGAVVLALAIASMPLASAKGPAGGTSCSKRNPCDTTPPSIVISTPNGGSSVEGSLTVSGAASDNKTVSKVDVQVDSGAFSAASGTSSWTASLATTSYPDGAHRLTARATDASGNTATAIVDLNFSNGSPSPSPTPTATPTESPGTPVPPPAIQPGSIGGYTFEETDRDGVYELNETPLPNQHIYLFNGAGTKFLASTDSDSKGWYQFIGLADATYLVAYEASSWEALRNEWAPSTNGSLNPQRSVVLSGSARADFGWRPIIRSTTLGSPITSYTGQNGLRLESYDDVVPAKELYDDLVTGSLVGAEASRVTIRFDSGSSDATSTSVANIGGVYSNFQAVCGVSYASWLVSNDRVLFHEYGHAWSLYYAYIVRQDPNFTGYLQARGLAGDARINSSYAWSTREMVAEDYRQLFGSSTASSFSQMNQDVPQAATVAGLREYLSGPFMQSGG